MSNDDEKLHPFNAEAYTPTFILEKTHENVKRRQTRGLVVIEIMRDGTPRITFSRMSMKTLCFAKAFFDAEFNVRMQDFLP